MRCGGQDRFCMGKKDLRDEYRDLKQMAEFAHVKKANQRTRGSRSRKYFQLGIYEEASRPDKATAKKIWMLRIGVGRSVLHSFAKLS